ncbi:bifunctional lysylphosphatidylglycerol flippase/synthetase MprF [Defluviimonas sp. SAOS-178_SWC]|uniref:bifunctional lysylphosphatidylglycerol flippase/synthetase MprF n=1 Tax=Defluviimonas sp. SAOS-178_SWC TaxID=3121287 RepID=UPI003222026A
MGPLRHLEFKEPSHAGYDDTPPFRQDCTPMNGAETGNRGGGVGRAIAHPAVRIAFPLLIVAIGIGVLHHFSRSVQWHDVRAALSAIPFPSLGTALLCVAASYAALSLYDVAALRSLAPGKVPLRLAAVAGASGFAISNFLGASWLTGSSVRMRIYSALGVDLTTVAHIVGMTWLAFFLGLTTVLGLLFSFHPQGLSAGLPISPGTEAMAGAGLLILLVAIYGWLALGHRQFRIGRVRIELPPLGLAAAITLIAVADMVVAAASLYVLLPDGIVANFVVFFVIYVGAVALGVLSHAPGGIGVFEAALVAGLGAGAEPDVLAALLIYRILYFFLPFLLAAAGLGLAWAVEERRSLGKAALGAYRIAQPAAPVIAAGIALIAGAILLASGSLPPDETRLGILRDILPLGFVEASHLAGSIAGVLLIIIARGLYRRLFRAWVVATALMAVGIVASLAKGLDWQEALSMLASLGLLALFRPAFYRIEGGTLFRLDGAWIVSLAALLATIIWIGFVVHAHTAYRDALWWQVAWQGGASRFLRASLAAAVIFGGISLQSLLAARSKPRTPEPVPARVRELLAACPRAGAQLALTGDKSFLISPDEKAFLAYADTGRTLIAQGDPVGKPESGRALIRMFRERADKMGRRVAFNAVTEQFLTTYLDLGLSIMKIGEVARVALAQFTLDGAARKDFRHARSRAGREGLVFEVIPAAGIGPVLPDLKTVSDAWLALKQGEEKGFSLGAFSEPYLRNFDVAVLRRGPSGPILAFANLWQGADRHEVSPDLMRYDPAGPNYAMDALFAELLLWARDRGFHWFTLGAAPFSGLDDRRFAPFWNRMGGLLYEHGEHFYRFEGLRAFKQKFDPVWTPHYLASPGGLAVPRVLYDLNVLISGGVRNLVN